MAKLDLDDFQLDEADFEARYPDAYLLWDHAGAIWNEARSAWPELEAAEAQPGLTRFFLGRGFELRAKLDRINVMAFSPDRKLAKFSEITEQFVENCTRNLDIASFTRVGLRSTFIKETDSVSAAAAQLDQFGLGARLSDDPFKLEGAEKKGTTSMSRWENDRVGARIDIQLLDRKFEFKPNPGVHMLEPFAKVQHGISIDVDYYTHAQTPVEAIDPRSWIEYSHKLVRRAISSLLQ